MTALVDTKLEHGCVLLLTGLASVLLFQEQVIPSSLEL